MRTNEHLTDADDTSPLASSMTGSGTIDGTQEQREVGASVWPTLSPREREVARALALGATNHEIGAELGIGVKTVDTHRGHVMKKLGMRNNVELARAAIRVGFVTVDEQLVLRNGGAS